MKFFTITREIVLYFILLITLIVLIYFSLTLESRGDESVLYLNSFKQAFSKFPAVDLSPYWAISSFYLWIIAALNFLVPAFNQLSFIELGRLFSVVCWVSILFITFRINKGKQNWPSLLILFNPYLLVYATRAHPLVPGLLLFIIFWVVIQQSRWALILLAFAVNFQVFIAGTCGLFLPSYPFKRDEILRFLFISLAALSGIAITILTWGGMLPENFYHSDLYKFEHVGGTPSYAYPISVLLLSGLPLWFIGQRSYHDLSKHLTQTKVVVISVIAGCLILLLLPRDVLGITSLATRQLLGPNSKLVWVSIYGLIGLGWLRIHRHQLPLFFGLVGSSVLIITLPYFYERISFFASFAPCLAWSLMPDDSNKTANKFYSPALLLSLTLSVLYQIFGSL